MPKISLIWQNTAISSTATAVQGVANLVTVIYLARVLQPMSYGIFSYTWAIIGVVSILTYLGIPPLLTRQLSRAKDHSPVITYGISLTGLLSITVTMAFIIGTWTVPGLDRYRLAFDVWAATVFFNGITPRWIFSGVQRLWIPSIGDMVGAMVRLGLTILLVHGPHDLVPAIGVTVFSIGMPILGELIWLRCLLPFRLSWVSWHQGYDTIRKGVPLGITAFVGVLYSGLDTWILHIFVGSRAVGLYSAAYRPVVFLSTFSAIYFNLTYPVLSRLTVQDKPLTQRVIRLAGLSILALVVPMGVGTDVVAGPLMRQAFGQQYAASGLVLAVLIWSWGFGILRDTFSTTLIAGNREVVFARIFAVAGAINAGLMFYLVRWGPVGTAAALVITQALLLVLSILAVRRITPHPIDFKGHGGYFAKIILNSLVMGVCVWLVRPHVSVEVDILVGIALYAGLTWLTKAVPWREVLATVRMAP